MHVRRTTLALCAVALTCAVVGTTAIVVALDRGSTAANAGPPAPSPRPSHVASPAADGMRSVVVNGSAVPVAADATVAAALDAAGLRPHDGYFISVVRQRRLGHDQRRPSISVNGRAATAATRVQAGDTIVARPGVDDVEPVEQVVVPLAPPWSPLYVDPHPGLVRIVRGALSKEVVSRRVVRAPRPGHLIRPGAVALTFDDGPAPRWTRRILRVLDRHRHTKATFCMVGREASAHPELVRAVVRAGHALCDHTWDHDVDLDKRPAGQQRLDVARGARAITRAAHGVRPRYFRAPAGHWSRRLEAIAHHQGMRPLRWTVDPRDWTHPGVSTVLRTIRDELRPGGVILLHDGGGNRSQTLRALRLLLRWLPRHGYHVVLPPSGG